MTRFARRTSLASLAAAAALAATGIAGAAPVLSGDDAADVPATLDPVVTQTFVDVEVAPTGDGPATEEDCQRYEQSLNFELAGLQRAMRTGNALEAQQYAALIEVDENYAQDDGCFVNWS